MPSRRELFDRVRAGPALFAGLPGGEVDLDRLAAHLAARGFDAGVYATDQHLEGVLWVQHGALGETWYFEAGGEEALLPVVAGHHLLRDLAARGGVVSVHLGSLPEPVGPAPGVEPAVDSPFAPPSLPPAAAVAREWPAAVEEPAPWRPPAGPAVPVYEVHRDIPDVAIPEPPARPWPAILAGVNSRVVRLRGPRLASLFLGALDKALAGHGGRVDGDRIEAPPLPESTWRVIVEAACAPIVAIAGRAFTDRTIAAAERELQQGRADGAQT